MDNNNLNFFIKPDEKHRKNSLLNILAMMQYADWQKKTGLSTNTSDPQNDYDYIAAFLSGQKAPKNAGEHWPSTFKFRNHPRRFLRLRNENGQLIEDDTAPIIDTTTMRPVKEQGIWVKNEQGGWKPFSFTKPTRPW